MRIDVLPIVSKGVSRKISETAMLTCRVCSAMLSLALSVKEVEV